MELTDNIIIGDIGSKDGTIEICKKYKAKIVTVPFRGDLSESKNYMLKLSSSWVMFMEPGEAIVSKSNNFLDTFKDELTSYKIKIIREDLITKEIRIWHKSNDVKFKNPVFETPVSNSNVENLNLFLASTKEQFNSENIKILQEWHKKKPVSPEPLYYISCMNLFKKEWRNFINSAETYLYANKALDAPCIMTRYYLSMVKTYIKNHIDYEGAVKNLVQCIAEKPTMAEFWCLLGDLYYNIGDYTKSKSMYENAIVLGSKRIESDEMPIEISKYKSYPLKMIKACEEIKEKTKVYKSV